VHVARCVVVGVSWPEQMLNEFELNRLKETVGLVPCLEWIQALKEHHNAVPCNSADEVLRVALHCDLKEVVGDLSVNNNAGSSNNAVMLRNAIEESMMLPNIRSTNLDVEEEKEEVSTNLNRRSVSNAKATLPSTFRHMIQVEEILDVSINAQERLELGPADECSNNNRRRCLKFFCSDGLSPSITAMETSPIPDISVNSLPGIKVLIRGSLQVRYGVLLLNEGNALVLGGCIPSLIPIRQKAIEAARKRAGIGIDPTIKALIWNNNQQQLLQEQDEEGYNDEEDDNTAARNDGNTLAAHFEAPNSALGQQRLSVEDEACRAIVSNATATTTNISGRTYANNNSTNNTAFYQMAPNITTIAPTSDSNTLQSLNIHQGLTSRTIVNPYRRLSSDAINNDVGNNTDISSLTQIVPVSSVNTLTSVINNARVSVDRGATTVVNNDIVDHIDLMDNNDNNYVLQDEEMNEAPSFPYRIDHIDADNDLAASAPISVQSNDHDMPFDTTYLNSTSYSASNDRGNTTVTNSSPSSIIRTTILPTPSMMQPVSFTELVSIYSEISSSQPLYEQYYRNNTTFIVPCKLHPDIKHTVYQFGLAKIKQLLDSKKKSKKSGEKVITYP
jgi:hypothetical protein